MKSAAFLFLVLTLALGCETPGQKMLDLKAEERANDAKESLDMFAEMHNMQVCSDHLGVTVLTTDRSRIWKKFAKSHRINGYPNAMSDADLQDCLKLPSRTQEN